MKCPRCRREWETRPRKGERISYKQAWEELMIWLEEYFRWPEQRVCTSKEEETKDILEKIEQLEKRIGEDIEEDKGGE